MLRWMAPMLSFTAEEAFPVFAPGASFSIFTETFWHLESGDAALLAKWERLRAIREAANKAIEEVRKAGEVGSSLQADLVIAANAEDRVLLDDLGDDLKFVTITSRVTVVAGDELAVTVTPSTDVKCERCWHWRADVGADAAHPTICGRCTSNLFGTGEVRRAA
jgi:isoleucyl-tRNA synthetase